MKVNICLLTVLPLWCMDHTGNEYISYRRVKNLLITFGTESRTISVALICFPIAASTMGISYHSFLSLHGDLVQIVNQVLTVLIVRFLQVVWPSAACHIYSTQVM